MLKRLHLLEWFKLRKYRKLHKARQTLLEQGLREGEHFITIADVPYITHKGAIRAYELLQQPVEPKTIDDKYCDPACPYFQEAPIQDHEQVPQTCSRTGHTLDWDGRPLADCLPPKETTDV